MIDYWYLVCLVKKKKNKGRNFGGKIIIFGLFRIWVFVDKEKYGLGRLGFLIKSFGVGVRVILFIEFLGRLFCFIFLEIDFFLFCLYC